MRAVMMARAGMPPRVTKLPNGCVRFDYRHHFDGVELDTGAVNRMVSALEVALSAAKGLQQPGGVAAIEYQHMAGHRLTVADPCTFTNACTPYDAKGWAYLARKWVDAAEAAAGDDEQRLLTVSGLRSFAEQLTQGALNCTALNCKDYVDPLVGATVRARMLVIAWGGSAPDIPGPWSPQGGWWDALLGRGGGIWKVLPWLVLALMASQRRSR